ncbi:MAG: hypothetical protein QM733_10425 [Ilumatobacteraceae bacterium]
MLTPEQHVALNDAYWNSKRSVADIRHQFGLTESELTKQLEAQPTGASRWFCHEPLVYANRRERNDAVIIVPLFDAERHPDPYSWGSIARR